MVSQRRAVVTGGGRGIGRAIALALASEGCDVAVVARTREEIADTAARARTGGRRALEVRADVTRADEVRTMAERAQGELGPIDILVNCAGEAESAPFHRTDLRLWERTVAVNLTSVFLCTSALLPGMIERGWGRVINVASSAGLTGYAYVTAYCAAKHGVVGLTRSLALEVAGKGVTVNALCPGYVDTEMTRRSADNVARKTGMSREEALAALAAFNPVGRLIQPDEVAAAALRLASSEAGAVNGETIRL